MQVDSRTELVIPVEIAKRLGISPQRVNVLASGPGFPKLSAPPEYWTTCAG